MAARSTDGRGHEAHGDLEDLVFVLLKARQSRGRCLLFRMQIDLAELPSDPALLQQVVRELAEALASKDAEVERLRQLIRRLQRSQFGRRSEQLDADQLQLGLEDLEQAVAASEAAQEAATVASAVPRRPARRNRGALPAHLPRIEIMIDVEDKTCPCCGGAMHVIGEDRSEMLDVVPAQYRVQGDPSAALRLSVLRELGRPGAGAGAAGRWRNGRPRR